MGRKHGEEEIGIKIVILGEPQGKGRVRFSRISGTAYTPEKTALYENLIKIEYIQQCNHRFSDDAEIEMHITAYYGIPKTATKKMLAQIENGLRPIKKPDADNVAKIVADALNGYAYKDDAQIVRLVVDKFYSTEARVEVEVVEL